jgi:diguanylate cyclase (GGDEF)-like protein
LVISIPAAILIALRTTSPIEKLVKASEKIEKGDYEVRVQIEQEDEIGVLGNRFNHMAEGLAEREKMEFLAFHDSLTKLPNRRLFFKNLQQAIDEKNKSVLIMIDLDGFKEINDKYGHDAGDETLRQIANSLNNFKKYDNDIIARLGGDEFAMLLNNIDNKEKISQRAKNIIEQIEIPIPFHDHALRVSASIGICFLNSNFTIKDWMKYADNACYDAKKSGKRTFKFSDH